MSTPLTAGAAYDGYLEDGCAVALRALGPGGAPCLRLVYEATLGSFLVFRRPPELDRDGVAEGSRLMVPMHSVAIVEEVAQAQEHVAVHQPAPAEAASGWSEDEPDPEAAAGWRGRA